MVGGRRRWEGGRVEGGKDGRGKTGRKKGGRRGGGRREGWRGEGEEGDGKLPFKNKGIAHARVTTEGLPRGGLLRIIFITQCPDVNMQLARELVAIKFF